MKRPFLGVFLASTLIASAASAQVNNGGFESGFTGWNNFLANTGGPAISGSQSALLGGVSAISQAITTEVGKKYTVSYSVANTLNATGIFQVFFGGSLLNFQSNLNAIASNAASQFTHTGLIANSTSTQFAVVSGRSDAGKFVLDSVSITLDGGNNTNPGIVQVPGPEIGASAIPVIGFAAYLAWRRRQKQAA